jgi:hypothetical protein
MQKEQFQFFNKEYTPGHCDRIHLVNIIVYDADKIYQQFAVFKPFKVSNVENLNHQIMKYEPKHNT